MMKTGSTIALAATLLLTVGLAGADVVTLDDSELSGLGGIWGASATVDDVAGPGVEFTITLDGLAGSDPHNWGEIGAEDWNAPLYDWSSYDGFGQKIEVVSAPSDVQVALFLHDGDSFYQSKPLADFDLLSAGDSAYLTLDFDAAANGNNNDEIEAVGRPDRINAMGIKLVNPSSDSQEVTIKVSAIPEPATMSLLAMGGLAAVLRRRRRA